MTVKEVILELQKLPPNMLVATKCCNDYDIDSLNGNVNDCDGVSVETCHKSTQFPNTYAINDNDPDFLSCRHGEDAVSTQSEKIAVIL